MQLELGFVLDLDSGRVAQRLLALGLRRTFSPLSPGGRLSWSFAPGHARSGRALTARRGCRFLER